MGSVASCVTVERPKKALKVRVVRQSPLRYVSSIRRLKNQFDDIKYHMALLLE